MRHCVAGYAVEEVMTGSAYVYHWSGSPEATVLLRTNSIGAWQIKEVQGVENRRLDASDQQAIAVSVAGSLNNSSAAAEPEEYAADRLWLLRAQSRPFPTPPINGSDLLIPIVSAEDLMHEHQEMGITFDNFWMFQVLSKTTYFFRWRGEAAALVLAVISGRRLTHIECLTREARPVPMPHKSKILAKAIQSFADAGYGIACSKI